MSGGSGPASPNWGERRDGLRPELVVIHYTAMQDCAAALARLCDPGAEVSAHWLLDVTGEAFALVPEDKRSWHAGEGAWRGQGDVNSRSIGIELANAGREPFAARQMAALEGLLAGIGARWGIGAAGVIAHSDMAPGRKADPGPRFDWRRLGLMGLALWPRGGGDPDAPLGQSLTAIGYPEVDPALRLAAFRLRFRPGAAGPETAQDRAVAADVAAQSGGVRP